MVNKRDLIKARKRKKDWKDLDNKDGVLLEKRIRNFMKEKNTDGNKLKEYVKRFKKIFIVFPRPVVINNLYIGDVFYKKIQINEALLYAEEKVPPNCFLMPDVYKTSILEYNSNKNKAIMFVKRRINIKINSENIKFEIGNVYLDNENFERYVFIKSENYPFIYLLRFTNYKQENPSEGIYKFKFFLEMENIGKINYDGMCRVLSDNQKEIMYLLKNKDKKLEDRFFEKVIFECFLRCKEVVEKEGLPFPEVGWLLEQIKNKYKQGL